MPYEEIREFPPTAKPLEKEGAVLEGILVETRNIERKVEGEPPRRSIVHEIKLLKATQCLTEISRGKWDTMKHPKDSHISVWGGRKGFDAKMELVEEGQQFRLTREAKIGAFIPFKLEVWKA